MDILIKKIIISVESINVILQKNGIKSIIQLDFENDPEEIKKIFEKYNISSVLDYTFDEKIVRSLAIDESGEQLRDYLTNCRDQHETLLTEIKGKLADGCNKGKDPAPAAKGMSWMKTNLKMALEPTDATVADLLTDGCNMGVKSLHRYMNQYKEADAVSKGIATRLIGLEDELAKQMRSYL